MNNSKIGVLFDLDGVLLDTEGIYSEFWAKVDELFPTGVDNFTSEIKGSNLETILGTYFPKEQHDEIVDILQTFQKDMPYNYFPGAIEFVKALHDEGIPMCIVTSSDARKMEAVYAQHPEFRGYFKDVVLGEMVSQPKPSPECFLLGAKLLGVKPQDCYIFEDSINGLKSAQAVGGKVIALSTTNKVERVAPFSLLVIDSFEKFTVDNMLSL